MTGDVADTAHARIRLDSLTSLRFFAAALVLMHHATFFLTPGTPVERLMSVGYVGVGFFFALSGFVLTWSFSPHLPVRNFYGRRFARIYPLHIVTAAVAALFLIAAGSDLELWPSVLNLALLQSWVPVERFGSSLNGVSWSLCCEAFFYALFPLLVAWVRNRPGLRDLRLLAVGVFIALVFVAAAVIAVAPADVAQQILYKGPEYRIGAFILGIVAAVAVQRGFRSRLSVAQALALVVAAYGVALVVETGLPHVGLTPFRVYADLITLPAALGLIVTAATADITGRREWLRDRRLVQLGDASFALYMVHYLLLAAWVEWVDVPSSLMGGVAEGIVACGLAVVVSLVVYRLLERPAEAALRRRIGTPKVTATAT